MKKSQALLTAALSALGMAAGAGTAHAQQAPVTLPPPPPPSVTTAWNGASETREEDRRFHVNGRFQYDIASTDADFCSATGFNSGTTTLTATPCQSGIRSYARRAFLGVDGRLTTNWRYNVKFDFNLSGSPSVRADDLYLEYAGQDFSFIVGNNNAVSPMEDRDSSLNIPFNERSFLISSSGVGKRPGVAFITNGGNWSLGAALASNDTLDTADTAANGTESYFVAGRATWAPIFEQTPDGTTLLHLGLYARYRDNGDGNGNALNGLYTYSPNALSNKSNNNASIGGAESDTFWNLEAAFQWNAFGAEAEYGQLNAQDSTLTTAQTDDGTITGYYFDVFWSPTGESRRYNAADGSFGAISPRRTLGSDGGIGHIMLAARYEDWDATDTVFGGNRNETTAYTLGATWVPISHVKFQLNYSHTDVNYVDNTTDRLTGGANPAGVQVNQDNNIDAVTFRTQFDW
jgi:phosphate-selective porin OprO/OprP